MAKQLDAAPGQVVCIGDFEVSWNEERARLLVRIQPGSAPDRLGADPKIAIELCGDPDEVWVKVAW